MSPVVASWPDENLLEVEDDIQYLAQNIKGHEHVTIEVGFTQFMVRAGSSVKQIRWAQLNELRRRVGLGTSSLLPA